MENPIVEKMLKEGIDSVNLSMLDEATRKKILDDVANKLYKQNKHIEAINVLSSCGNNERLIKMGEEFVHYQKYELAALCFIPTKDKVRLNEIAVHCIKNKNYKLASEAYEAAGNYQMAGFIKRNFVKNE